MAEVKEGGGVDGERQVENWHVKSCDETAAAVVTDLTAGLSDTEAARRLECHGPNKLTEKRRRTIWERIWAQVNNVLVFILVVVAVVSAIKAGTSTGEDAITSWVEVGLIIGVITLNTWIGIRQEGSAEKSAEALKSMLSSAATVIRGGCKKEVPAEDLVVGDLVSLSTGDKIPADIRIVRCANLACQEAALTGEALAVDKVVEAIECEKPESVPLGDRKNLAFSATLVAQGEALGVVVATGDDTEIGEINMLVSQVETKKTNVLVQIDIVSRWIALFVCVTAIVTFLVAYFYTANTKDDALDSISIALVTSVAMIPEGLAAIVTLTYAYAVTNMSKENAIVRVLPAVETLGSVTVICSDKTGTLTKNVMTLTAVVTSTGRFKFNTDAEGPAPSNFIREDTFMAHDPKGPKKDAIEVVAEEDVDVKPAEDNSSPEAAAPQESAPGEVPQGGSPTKEWIQTALAGGVLCSNAQIGDNGSREGDIGNPTELAIIRAAYFGSVDYKGLREEQPAIAQVPFSSEYKFMATIHKYRPEIDAGRTEGCVLHCKGAPDRLIALSSHQAKAGKVGDDDVEPIDRDYWLKQAENLSSHGLRVLALCRAEKPADFVKPGEKLGPELINGGEPFLTIVGLCAIVDPPRPECVDSIKEAHGAGVRVAMITGDHAATALAIGDQLGLVDREHPSAITGPELDAMSDDELREAVMAYNVFARASPENKIRIVRALQANGQVCSMTGDGVNDAPALTAADMGVAMGLEGTDVARESAEMILADDNFSTIVKAVKEGRVVWDNLRKVLLFNTPVNNAQGLSVLFGLIAGLEDTPLTPIQVLYVNLICAVALGFVLAVEPAEEGIMDLPPRKPGKRLIGRYLLFRIALGTVTLVAFTVGSVFWIRAINDGDYGLPEERSQASNTLTFGAISICLSARFSYNSSFHPRLFRGNIACWYAVFITAALQVIITYVPKLNSVVFQMGPMDWKQWLITIFFMVMTFAVMECEKLVLRTLKRRGFDTDDTKSDSFFDREVEEVQQPYAPQDSQRSATMHSNRLHR